jgi:hypothetical protein
MQKSSSLAPILSQLKLFHTLTHFLKTNFNVTSHLRLGLRSNVFPSRFPTHIVYIFMPPRHATYSVHLIFQIFVEGYKIRSSSLSKFHPPPSTSSALGPDIFTALFTYILSLCSLRMRDQVSYPYISNRKNYRMFSLLDMKLEDKRF